MSDQLPATIKPELRHGLFHGIDNKDYHACAGVSKSGLWKLHQSTPHHFKNTPPKERANHFDVGEAIHLSVLEPEQFEKKVYRGPDDRRGNKWKDAEAACALDGLLLLTSADYDMALAVRDAVHADPLVNTIITMSDAVVEASAFWTDEQTGVLCRCRPDLYVPSMNLVLDLKSTKSAAPRKFASDSADYGYHAQDAFYTDGLNGIGCDVDAFVFLAVEKDAPYAHVLYEMKPSAVVEGRATMRHALDTYAACEASGVWPSYASGVQELAYPRWAYKLTQAPDAFDE